MATAMLGFCEIDITPTIPVQTIGFGREDQLSRGVLSKLVGQISVWKFEITKMVIITIDNIGFSKLHTEQLRNEVSYILNIAKSQVMICFSHTHSAPNDDLEKDYFLFLCDQIKEGVIEANNNMTPILAAWGNTFGDIGVNRRSEQGDIDKRIGVLKILDADTGALKLLLLRLTAHANVLKRDNYLISSDYFGSIRDLLQEKYKCYVMVTQGAAGNIAPKYFKSEITPFDASDPKRYVRSDTALEDMANEVFQQIDKIISDINSCNVEYIRMYSIYQQLEADVPKYDRAVEIVTEAKAAVGIDGSAWLSEVERLLNEGIYTQIDEIEIQYFSISNGCICGVPNEIMCEFALQASEQLGNNMFYFGGYTNGCTSYFPTEKEYNKGGYEVHWAMLEYYKYYGRVAALNPECASKLVKAVVENAPIHRKS